MVKVKVISVQDGRVSLSIKKAEEQKRPARPPRPAQFEYDKKPAAKTEISFEDKLKQFMQESENKMSDLRAHTENRRGRGRR